MKWNMVIVALVLSIGLCSQSFGHGLLNKMLGCGCASSCGCAAAPSCGCEAAPSCGCEPSCGCAAAPSCGCEPSCGCAPSCGCGGGLLGCAPKCANPCCSPLKLNLPCHKGGGCGCAAAPSCGCEPSCGCAPAPSCCTPVLPRCPKKCCLRCNQGGGLLQGLMSLGNRCGGCCGCASSCGCAAPCDGCSDGLAPAMDGGDDVEASDAAPMPPAPIVDPSAFVPGKRRVVPTSAVR